MKRLLSVLVFMFLASCSSVQKFEGGGERSPSAETWSEFAAENILATYKPSKKGKVSAIKKFGIRFSPFGGSIVFRPRKQVLDSKGRESVNEMDCRPNAENTGWICRSGCEGGYLVVHFNRDVKLDRIQVQPFNINMCSGNDLSRNVSISSKIPINFTLQNVRLEK